MATSDRLPTGAFATKVTYRVTGVTNLVVLRRDRMKALNMPVAINEDIHPDDELEIHDVPGIDGGTGTLVRREGGVNSPAVTIKRTWPRRISVAALHDGVVNIDLIAKPFEMAYGRIA